MNGSKYCQPLLCQMGKVVFFGHTTIIMDGVFLNQVPMMVMKTKVMIMMMMVLVLMMIMMKNTTTKKRHTRAMTFNSRYIW